MSFFSNFSSDHCPGTISGNPLNGLCEKVCIQAEKIFDAGIIQTRLENYAVTLIDPPDESTYPLTFVSARSVGAATVSNVTVDRQSDGKHRAHRGRHHVRTARVRHAFYRDGGRFVRFARRHVQSRNGRVYAERVRHLHSQSFDAGRAARSQLRLLRHSPRAGILARGLHGIL